MRERYEKCKSALPDGVFLSSRCVCVCSLAVFEKDSCGMARRYYWPRGLLDTLKKARYGGNTAKQQQSLKQIWGKAR